METVSLIFFFKVTVFLFCFFCAVSALLNGLFPSCGEWGLLSSCHEGASHCSGSSCCGVQAQSLWHTSWIAPQHVGSSLTRDRTHVSCIGRWNFFFSYHRATRKPLSLILYQWASPSLRCIFQWEIALQQDSTTLLILPSHIYRSPIIKRDFLLNYPHYEP